MVCMSNVSSIERAPSVRFAVTARLLAETSRSAGLRTPAFKSPPRRDGVDRTIRRQGRDVVVAVRVKGRPFGAVVADLVEGVVVANELTGHDAGRARALLWEALENAELTEAA